MRTATWVGWRGVALAVVVGVSSTARGAATVELIVRGADGAPAADVEVHVRAVEQPPGEAKRLEARGRTDREGRLAVEWREGAGRMVVTAPGVGYGYTGLFEAVGGAGKVTRAPLPALAPFAVIEGTVPADVAAAGEKLEVHVRPVPGFDEVEVIAAAEGGRFRAEVRGGSHWVSANAGTRRVAQAAGAVFVAPGERRAGVTLRALPKEEVATQGQAFREARPGRGKTVTWVAGTVRHAAGRPVAGATVYAYAVHHGGIRMYSQARKATADAQGRYEVKGEGGLSMFTAAVVAHAPGRPPAWGWIQGGDAGEMVPVEKADAVEAAAPPPAGAKLDLVLPAAGGRLEVTVLRDGRPAADVWVMASLEGVNLKDLWAAGGGSEEENEVEAVVHPTAKTDAAGVARFDALLPGAYRVVAAEGDEGRVRGMRESWRADRSAPFGEAEGVAVRASEVARHQMAIYAQSGETTVRVQRADGKAMTGQDGSFEYGSVASGGSWTSTGLSFDEAGVARARLEHAGLWTVAFKYRQTPVKWIPMRDPPYFEARGVVASSPLLEGTIAPRLTAMRVEPASVVVELQDAQGRPARGTAELVGRAGDRMAAGSSGADGVVRFDGVITWNGAVRAYLAEGAGGATRAIDLGDYDAPLPAVESLRGRVAVLDQPVEPKPNTERRVVMRAQAVGFVRGRVRPPAGVPLNGFGVSVDEEAAARGAKAHYRQETGEFVAGPFAPGRVRLTSWRLAEDGAEMRGTADVAVQAGQVAEGVEIVPAAVERSPRRGNLLIGAGGATALSQDGGLLTGRVLMADGKTPALGARVLYFGKGQATPSLHGLVDARGEIAPRGLWQSANAGERPKVDENAEAVVVAYLPGAVGAVVKPAPKVGEGLDLVLPAARSVRGTVTVGGGPPPAKGRVRVYAAREGDERLGGWLSVQATAQADGAFELAGLTPGRYAVQASLDDVWLSSAVAVEVGDAAAGPVALAIGHLGGPVVVRLVGADGQPVRGRAVVVESPPGPLARMAWPATFESDGEGEVWVPALEAGRHRVRLKEGEGAVEVIAPPLPANVPGEGTIVVGK